MPSVKRDGAITISTFCISLIFLAPSVLIDVLIAPSKLCVPSSSNAGPFMILSQEPVEPTSILVPLGKTGLGVAIPQ